MIVILKCQGNYEQNENTIHRMGENICNLSDQKGINFQNIQTIANYQETKKKPSKNRQKT